MKFEKNNPHKGAYGSLFNAISSFVESGDEIIIIEPFYDCYAPLSVIAGAKCVYVPLKPKVKLADGPTSSADWKWDLGTCLILITKQLSCLFLILTY